MNRRIKQNFFLQIFLNHEVDNGGIKTTNIYLLMICLLYNFKQLNKLDIAIESLYNSVWRLPQTTLQLPSAHGPVQIWAHSSYMTEVLQ